MLLCDVKLCDYSGCPSSVQGRSVFFTVKSALYHRLLCAVKLIVLALT